METHRLLCHPDTPSKALEGVVVEFEREGDSLWLRYTIEASPDDLVLPPPAAAGRKDGLWQATCVEAFVRASNDEGYAEFNFSPSSEWAAYRFSGYRADMEDLGITSGPDIGLDASDSHLALEATIPLPEGPHQLALCAVIEETGGTKSYWALAHPQGKPDFHHPDCFALKLPAPVNT